MVSEKFHPRETEEEIMNIFLQVYFQQRHPQVRWNDSQALSRFATFYVPTRISPATTDQALYIAPNLLPDQAIIGRFHQVGFSVIQNIWKCWMLSSICPAVTSVQSFRWTEMSCSPGSWPFRRPWPLLKSAHLWQHLQKGKTFLSVHRHSMAFNCCIYILLGIVTDYFHFAIMYIWYYTTETLYDQ